MKVRYYSVKDLKGGFGQPYPYSNDEIAKRNYRGALLDSKPNMVNQYPEDFELYFVGTFDDETSKFECPEFPEFICNAATFGGVPNVSCNKE